MDNELIEAYYLALKKYSEEDIQKAGYKCLDECDYFPKPVDISRRIAEINKTTSYSSPDEDFIFSGQARCIECGKIGFSIKEPKATGQWKCRQCYSGLTVEQYKAKIQEIIKGIKPYKFKKIEREFTESTAMSDAEINARRQELHRQAQQLRA